ncbi:hypothetical protein KR044_004521 [Drosophila immigrans]|nr:hypothetical protein KR044_004521 [Drosophila immigrans]
MLRELVKWVYHLLVDVVEQCWQLTRNADDINVTPRLQLAINEVIAELRVARQAATTTTPATSLQLMPMLAETENEEVDKELGEPELQLEQPKPVVKTGGAKISDDQMQLRIQLAEAASARRMLLSLQSSFQEHLAPINVKPQTKQKPKSKSKQQTSDNRRPQSTADEADLAYQEFCESRRKEQR